MICLKFTNRALECSILSTVDFDSLYETIFKHSKSLKIGGQRQILMGGPSVRIVPSYIKWKKPMTGIQFLKVK